MNGLRIDDLVVEYASGSSAIRPIDGLNLELKPAAWLSIAGTVNNAKVVPITSHPVT